MFFSTRPVRWLNEPEHHVADDALSLTTRPGTDLWQRTYYGFRRNNAHAVLTAVTDQYFTFTATAEFDYSRRFDQCGVIIHQDAENWFKASSEHERAGLQRLGSVVTNGGWSDWATTDLPDDVHEISYRLSRRERDFRIEWALPGGAFHQMRILHLAAATGPVDLGVYACSPEDGSFTARFTDIGLGGCLWEPHGPAAGGA